MPNQPNQPNQMKQDDKSRDARPDALNKTRDAKDHPEKKAKDNSSCGC